MKGRTQTLASAFAIGAFALSSTAALAGSAEPMSTMEKDSMAQQGWTNIELSYTLADPRADEQATAHGQAGPAGPQIMDGRHIHSPVNLELQNTIVDPESFE